MVTSERFTGLISLIVGTDLEGVITFLRSEGVNVSFSEKPSEVTRILVYSLANSEVFKTNFIRWAESRYQNYSNYGGGGTFSVNGVRYTQAEWEAYKKARAKANKNESNYSGENYASGGFDPMATQGSGQEFDAMSSQQGANLKEDGFANASGEFNPMDTQSGGFSTMESQHANFLGSKGGERYTPYDPNVEGSGSAVGNFLRGGSFEKIINTGLGFWQNDTEFKQKQKLANAGLEAERIRLEQLKEQGKLTQQQFDAQYQLAKQQAEAPKSTVIFWVIGGVVLLGALGTTIYFATRKK